MLLLDVHDLGAATVFEFTGHIVTPEAELVREAVTACADASVAVLDLARITAIDAAGLGVLVSLLAWEKKSGVQVKLLNLTPRIEFLLELTHLRPLFKVCSMREIAELFCLAAASRPMHTCRVTQSAAARSSL